MNCAGISKQRFRGNGPQLFFQTLRFIILTAYYPNMPLTLDQIAEEAMRLPPASRALLADKLVESLETEGLDEIQRLWSAEAIRRRDEIRCARPGGGTGAPRRAVPIMRLASSAISCDVMQR